jgi:hypothetical protein
MSRSISIAASFGQGFTAFGAMTAAVVIGVTGMIGFQNQPPKKASS